MKIISFIIALAFIFSFKVFANPVMSYSFDKSLEGLDVLSPKKPYSISISKTIKRLGNGAVRFELRGGEVRTSKKGKESFRAELATEHYVNINSENWYSFSLFIPSDFPIEKNRLVIGQWWSPSDHGEKSKSPALAFRFVNGRFYISMRHSEEKIIKNGSGKESILFETRNFSLGKWNDFVIHVKWSYKKDGFVEIWNNNKKVVNHIGGVGYNDDRGPAFQFGIYRDKSDKTYVIYFDEYRHGQSRDDVSLF